ncbi:MAG TPA: hypothetical protein VK543_09225 [Puia sp.]|nr:hypothetical protein [Puia sp.]
MKSAGKLADYRVLEVKVDPSLYKTAQGRDFIWENYNKPFLDKAVNKGRSFKLFDDPDSKMIFDEQNPSRGFNFFGREIDYLTREKGYIRSGDQLIPGKK